MTEKEFLHQLRRGIGSAIIELHNSTDNAKYKDIVLRCCLKNVAYDQQSEGTKGAYLYTAICALGCQSEFLPILADAYLKPGLISNFDQITDILIAYQSDGINQAKIILNDKYKQLREVLQHRKYLKYNYNADYLETLMIEMIYIDGWESFKLSAHDVGSIILAQNDAYFANYEWFLESAEKLFGKQRVLNYLEKASQSSRNINALVNNNQMRRSERRQSWAVRDSEPEDLEGLLERINNLLQDGMRSHLRYTCLKFGSRAGAQELLKLAKHIEHLHDVELQTILLSAFRRTDYPGDLTCLLDMALTENEELQESAIAALERLSDDRIHKLGIEFLETGKTEFGLSLLINNWKKSDDAKIEKIILKSKTVMHPIQMSLLTLYEKHKSSSCKAVLLHSYRNGECSFCREGTVKAMGKNGVLPDEIVLECQFDSYAETRAYANLLIKRRGLLGSAKNDS